MNATTDREQLVGGLVRIGEKLMTGEDEAEVDSYFVPDYKFHGPDGGEWDYSGLKEYFKALRAAFDNLDITRANVVVENKYLACRRQSAGLSHASLGTPPSGRCRPTGNRCSSS